MTIRKIFTERLLAKCVFRARVPAALSLLGTVPFGALSEAHAQGADTYTYQICVYDTHLVDGDRIDLDIDDYRVLTDHELGEAPRCVPVDAPSRRATSVTVTSTADGSLPGDHFNTLGIYLLSNSGQPVGQGAYGHGLSEDWSLCNAARSFEGNGCGDRSEALRWVLWPISENRVVLTTPGESPQFEAPVSPIGYTYTVGETIENLVLPEAFGGAAPLTYRLEPVPPAGLRFDPVLRMLSGRPLAVSPEEYYTYTATGADGRFTERPFPIRVVGAAPEFVVKVGIPDLVWRKGESVADLVLPEASGGLWPLTYALRPALPPGLSFDPATRVLSGTPAAASPARAYTYTATDAAGRSAVRSFIVEVGAAPGVTLATVGLTVTNGAMTPYYVRLDSNPGGTVTVTPRSANPDVAFRRASVTFDASNWHTPQEIVVTFLGNTIVEDERPWFLHSSPAAGDQDMLARNNLHESVTVRHSVTGYGDVTEGGEIVFQVRRTFRRGNLTIGPTVHKKSRRW